MRHRDRVERAKERRKEIEELANSGDLDRIKEAARSLEREENELIWAHYRARDITQTEAAEAVITDPAKVPGQSQISRICSQIDEEIVYYSAYLGDYTDEVHEKCAHNPLTPYGIDVVDTHPETYLEALKDCLAEHLLRRAAFSALTRVDKPPEDWMLEYIPDDIADCLVDVRTDLYLADPYGEDRDPPEDIEAELQSRKTPAEAGNS